MAKIALVTVYDEVAVGLRIMAQLLNRSGHSATLFFLKRHRFVPIPFSKKATVNYECIADGILKGTGYDVSPWTDYEVELLIEKLVEAEPDIIGFGSRSPLDDVNIHLLTRIRSRLSNAIVVAGGYGPSLRPEKYLEAAQFVMFGESDREFAELADRFDDRLPLEETPNLIYKNPAGAIFRNPVSNGLKISTERHSEK